MTCNFLWCCCANMEGTIEQCYTVKFCFKLGLRWRGRELIEDEHCVGRLTNTRTNAQVAKVKKVLESDRQMKRELKGHLFDSSRQFKQRRPRLSTVFRKLTSSGLLTSGRHAELSVSMQEVCILKIIK